MAKKRDREVVESGSPVVPEPSTQNTQEAAVETVEQTEQTEQPDTQPADQDANTRPVYDPLSNVLQFSSETADSIRAGIEAGHIFTVPAKVTIRKAKSPTGKDEVQPFIAYFALDYVGEGLLCAGKEEPSKDAPEEGQDTRTDFEKQLGACDHFNYGYGLKMYQNPIRLMLEELIAGPEKEIAKRVKSLIEGHLFETEAEARAFVVEKRIAAGLPV